MSSFQQEGVFPSGDSNSILNSLLIYKMGIYPLFVAINIKRDPTSSVINVTVLDIGLRQDDCAGGPHFTPLAYTRQVMYTGDGIDINQLLLNVGSRVAI